MTEADTIANHPLAARIRPLLAFYTACRAAGVTHGHIAYDKPADAIRLGDYPGSEPSIHLEADSDPGPAAGLLISRNPWDHHRCLRVLHGDEKISIFVAWRGPLGGAS